VHLVWKDRAPIRSATGLWLTPDTCFSDAPDFDVICVPGGAGVNVLLNDTETLDFLRRAAASARFVTSVCTGSLLLGQAGLLKGRKATTHWNALDFLDGMGALPVKERVVRDGNLITAGGVTSGIDFGLSVVAELIGQDEAETVQLMLEYAPAPPFDAGTPETARPAIVSEAKRRVSKSRHERQMALNGQ
tara:strand:- start:1552 stop:2121 length:570 start_codon:yes stop_codon:yes gene_type:complete